MSVRLEDLDYSERCHLESEARVNVDRRLECLRLAKETLDTRGNEESASPDEIIELAAKFAGFLVTSEKVR